MPREGYRGATITEDTAKRVDDFCKKRVKGNFSSNAEYLIKKALGDDVQ